MVFAKPENALKRAEEFIDVGKKQRALDTLYEVIRSKKHRSWQKIHEPIMQNYLSLCVDLKESHMAKDGLHQYKTICQNVNVKSLEDVINGFLQLAEDKAEKAKKTASDANIIVDVDDLEVLNSPESLLLKAVSGESSQDRADRDYLAPWLKFVWESYKQCLELLKNNNKLENLYQQVAKQAFAFCVKYQRKTEFRKLCETIRQHMVQSQKYAVQPTSIDLNKPETQNNHLETRLFQLNHAISMELWQEAYKAVEDIYSLMNLSRTKPKPSQMFNYYSKLSLIFWKAGNQLFHAATLQKLFVLLREQKKTITNEELNKISTRLLLATLAIPIPPNRSVIDECLDQDEITQEKLKRLSSLLNLSQPPTRVSLIKDLAKYNIVQHVYPEIRDLYKWLELEFHPLKLSERVSKCLEFIGSNQELVNEKYMQYVPAIKEIAVVRLLKQISQIYTSIEIKRFVQLTPGGIEQFHLEKLIVDAAKLLDLQVRINHQTKSLHFGNDLYVTQKDDFPEGPSIQSMPSEQIRNQLITMSDGLQEAHELICSAENKAKRVETAAQIAQVCRQTSDKHHADLLRRKQLIEEQKEMYERLTLEREQAEAEEKKLKQEEKERLVSSVKLQKDNLIRDMDRKLQGEAEEDQNRLAEIEDIELKKQIEQANKEKKELMEKLKKEEKKLDHFVRACHEVEVPLLVKIAEEDSLQRKVFWEKKELERIENLKKEQQLQAENRDRLLRMFGDKDTFESEIHAARREEFEKKMAQFKEKLNAVQEAKLAERKEKRKAERKNAYLKELEAKKNKEEMEKKQKEDEERRKKLDEQAEIQRKREKEMEERLASQQARESREQQPKVESKPYRPRHLQQKEAEAPPVEAESPWRRGGGEEAAETKRERQVYGRERPAYQDRKEVEEKKEKRTVVGEDSWRRPERVEAEKGEGERERFHRRDDDRQRTMDFARSDDRPRTMDFKRSDDRPRTMDFKRSEDRPRTMDFARSDDKPRTMDFARSDDKPRTMDSGRSEDRRDGAGRGGFGAGGRAGPPRSGAESNASTGDSWRRGPAENEPERKKEEYDAPKRVGRSYKEERHNRDEPQEGVERDGWTEVRGKK